MVEGILFVFGNEIYSKTEARSKTEYQYESLYEIFAIILMQLPISTQGKKAIMCVFHPSLLKLSGKACNDK